VKVDPDAAPILEEGNRQPHLFNPVFFIADTRHGRILRAEFNFKSHKVEAVITVFIDGLNDPWECIEWRGKLIVSERLSHRVTQYSMQTAELERVIAEGAALASVNDTSRFISRSASLERIREEDIVAPEGIYAERDETGEFTDWLGISSQAMAQVKRVHLITDEWGWTNNIKAYFSTGNKFAKLTISDGSFGPLGTEFVGQWDARMPQAILPNGDLWQYGWGPSVTYDICCAIGGGRFVYAGAGEGIYELRLRTDETRGNSTRAGHEKWIELGYHYTHGEKGFGFHGQPLPWGEDPDIDYFLERQGHTQ